jgi:hypothetical protein
MRRYRPIHAIVPGSQGALLLPSPLRTGRASFVRTRLKAALAGGKYAGCNQVHLTELLAERDEIMLSRSAVRRIMQEAGMASPRTRRAPQHRKRRERYPRVGMLLQIDGSPHDWLERRGPRLAPGLPDLVPALEREGALRLAEEERAALLRMSPATIDRRLAAAKQRAKPRGLGTTKPGSLLKQQIPVKTYTPWSDQRPGFEEVDLVAHCGDSAAGEHLFTLDLVDVATGWTECVGVPNKGQRAVVAALDEAGNRFDDDPDEWPGRMAFWNDAMESGVPGVGLSIQGFPGGTELFRIEGKKNLDRLKKALGEKYEFVKGEAWV